MRSLIAAVFFVATLLSVSSSAFAQELGPSPTPSLGPSSQSSSTYNTPAIKETGRYHPCPASVGFGNGRSVGLGLDEHVHVARSADGYGYRHHYGYHYG
jgi:hypothetical protein